MTVDLVTAGRALGAPARAEMLELLLDGTSHSSKELANAAGVRAAAASEHLAILRDAGLVTRRRIGRVDHYELASARVAESLELLVAGPRRVEVMTLTKSREQVRLSAARTCYDHLAGRLGVAVTAQFVRSGWVDLGACLVSSEGAVALCEVFNLDVRSLSQQRRPLIRSCIDWTERKPHLAGSLGAAVATTFFDREWVTRRVGSRGLHITNTGRDALHNCGISCA